MNTLFRLCTVLFFSFTCLVARADTEPTWELVSGRVGWWKLVSEQGVMTAIMTNSGLQFIAFYRCPPGSARVVAELLWYAGDLYSTRAVGCHGQPHIENVSFHVSEEFFSSLPVLARIHYHETALARSQTAER